MLERNQIRRPRQRLSWWSIFRVKPQLHSFDIFDTVLTRTFAVPSDLFVALGEEAGRRGLLQIVPGEFARKRMAAESAARRTAPAYEPGLGEIYAVLACDLGLAPAETGRLRELELEMEEAALQPVPGMQQRVAAARGDGRRVVFISDMYLPAAFLERVLTKYGFFQAGDRVYVSGEARASKAGGQLYLQILSELGVPPGDWVHLGDNELADNSVPKKLGISTEPVTAVRLSRYEWIARGEGSVAPVWRSRLAAAMRLARLRGHELAGAQRTIWDTGGNVVGPLWFGFVEWCLEQARQRGLRRLYFVARDGQILQRIAARIAARRSLPVECRYLYGSRQAWHLPSVERVDDAMLEWLFIGPRFLSVEQVLGRLGLEPEQFAGALHAAGLPRAGWRENLTAAQCSRLRELVWSPSMAGEIAHRAAAERELVVEYLEQEGFFDGTPAAIVDIGWHGNMQRSLAGLLRLAGRPEATGLTGLYFGLLRRHRSGSDQVLLDYWPNDPASKESITDQNLVLIEMLAAADHGSVTGFRKHGGQVVPMLNQAQNHGALDWGLKTLHVAILAFCDTWLELEPAASCPKADLQALTRELLVSLTRHPQADQAATWAAFPHSTDQLERHFESFAPPMSFLEVVRAILRPQYRPLGWWMEGTQAIQPSLTLAFYLQLRRWKRGWTVDKNLRDGEPASG